MNCNCHIVSSLSKKAYIHFMSVAVSLSESRSFSWVFQVFGFFIGHTQAGACIGKTKHILAAKRAEFTKCARC